MLNKARRSAPALIVAFVGALSATFLAITVYRLTMRMPMNGNEGWNALHAMHAMTRVNFYDLAGLSNFPNYPPLSFYVVGSLGKIFGDNVMAGRALAFVSILVTAANIGLISHKLGATKLTAIFAAILALLYASSKYAGYVGMNDPQWFGHALQSTGLMLLIRSPAGAIERRHLVYALLFIFAGGLVKHNLLPIPLAVTIWLAVVDRRAFVGWLVGGVVLTVVAGLAFYLLYGASFFQQLVGHERIYSLELMKNGSRDLIPLIPYFLFAGLAAILFRGNRDVWLVGLYLVLAVVLGLLFDLGRGVSQNTYFDVLIAVMPLVGLGSAWLLSTLTTRQGIARSICLLLVALPVLGRVPEFAVDHVKTFGKVGQQPKFDEMYELIAAAEGPVACENPTLCYWAGRENAIDFTNVGQKLENNEQTQQEFADLIASQELALIQVNGEESGRLTDEANSQLQASYEIFWDREGVLYRPKTPPTAQ